MSQRSDSVLITGKTSEKRLERLKQSKEVKKNEREQKKSTLTPVEDLMFAEADKIRDEIHTQLLEAVRIDTDKEQVKELLISLNLNKVFVDKFKNRMSNILRKKGDDEA